MRTYTYTQTYTHWYTYVSNGQARVNIGIKWNMLLGDSLYNWNHFVQKYHIEAGNNKKRKFLFFKKQKIQENRKSYEWRY